MLPVTDSFLLIKVLINWSFSGIHSIQYKSFWGCVSLAYLSSTRLTMRNLRVQRPTSVQEQCDPVFEQNKHETLAAVATMPGWF